MLFSEMNLNPLVLQGLSDAGYTEATPVQIKTWRESVVNGSDIMVQSQTGTGKTGAFLLPIFQHLLSEGRFKGSKAMILAPTRELAVQIYDEAKLLGTHLPLKFGCVYGGVGYGQQEAMLLGGVDLLIGTPGRLLDFVGSKKIIPKDYNILVIDEADRLLDMGFYPDMQKIFRMMPAREERLTMLLSATISTRVSSLTWEYMNSPVSIEIESTGIAVESIDQKLYHVARDEKMAVVLGIMAAEQPKTTIVFCNTKRAAEEVSKRLELNGIASAFLMGDLPQSRRLKIINDMKEGRVPVLVATDVAARGLHVDALDMVINYDLPEDAENYVHRIGRTARAGASGKARSLACEKFVYSLEGIEKYVGMKIPVAPVTDELVAEDKSKGIRIRLEAWDDEADRRDGRPSRDSRGPRDGRGPRDAGRSREGVRPPRDQRKPDAERSRKVADAVAQVAGGSGPGATSAAKAPQRAQEGRRSENNRRPRPDRDGRRQDQNRDVHNQGAAQRHAPAGQVSLEERIAFYKKKFGADFDLDTAKGQEQVKKEEGQAKSTGPKKRRGGNQTGPDIRAGRPQGQSQGQGSGQASSSGQTSKSAATGAKRQGPKQAPAAAPKKEISSKPKGVLGWLKSLFRGS